MQYRLLYHLQRVDNALKTRKDLNDMHHMEMREYRV